MYQEKNQEQGAKDLGVKSCQPPTMRADGAVGIRPQCRYAFTSLEQTVSRKRF